jgi:outer membrane protein assembly factor BamB
VGTFGNEVLGVDLAQAAVRWRYRHEERTFPFYASAAVANGVVVVGGRDRLVHGIEAESGAGRWVFAAGARVDASPVIAGQRVYVASMRGRLHGLDLATGAEMWTFDTGSAFVASPAVSGRRLVIGSTDGLLYCFAEPLSRD